jgi:ParB-like chromosome segregation protein Spo0J
MNETFENPIKPIHTTIRIPAAYVPLLEDIRLLTADQNNPNRTTVKQQAQIWKSLQEYGWAYPIITNKDGVYADGEQRADICKQHGEFFAPVLRLPVSDVDRRMLRQILNKLKGKHSKDLDAAEFVRIAELGKKEDLKMLLASVGERLPDDFDGKRDSVIIPETWELIIECKDEAEQQRFYEKLRDEGYKLRILTL